ncbi:hypothetical protein RM96_27045 [Cupriavidus sp. IDO]|nr:hypothetical protein RM96_27045 [Cupriavidus sp. IDO]
MRGLAARLDRSMAVGIEGAGLVVAAGSSPAAQALLNRRVARWAMRCTRSIAASPPDSAWCYLKM